MRQHLCAAAFASIAALAFSACSARGTVPLQSAPAAAQPMAAAPFAQSVPERSLGLLTKRDPCDIAGTWYFEGSCIKKHLRAKGDFFDLAPYKGITLKVGTGPNNASGAVSFVVGEGTNYSDITGTYVHAFPFYGTTYCSHGVSTSTVPCTGKPLVYFEILNNVNVPVTFNRTPQIAIDAKKFPGTSCTEDVMEFNDYGYAGWNLLGLNGTVANGKLVIKSVPATRFWSGRIALTGYGFAIYAVVCS